PPTGSTSCRSRSSPVLRRPTRSGSCSSCRARLARPPEPTCSRTRRRRTTGCSSPRGRRRRSGAGAAELGSMPRRKAKSKLRPKLPSRVRKTRTKRSSRAQGQHPELWGLGSVALGLFLGAVLYLGWNGGYVGGWLGDGLDRLVGDAKY